MYGQGKSLRLFSYYDCISSLQLQGRRRVFWGGTVCHLKYSLLVGEEWRSRTFWKFSSSFESRSVYFIDSRGAWAKKWYGQYRSDRTVSDALELSLRTSFESESWCN